MWVTWFMYVCANSPTGLERQVRVMDKHTAVVISYIPVSEQGTNQ